MRTPSFLGLACLIGLSLASACNESDDTKDMQQPAITSEGIVACPVECQTFRRGDVIDVHFILTDDVELGNYNIEVHNNFDHHTHSHSATECLHDEAKSPVNPWIYDEDFAIPAGQTRYEVRVELRVPDDADTGDYHFALRVTDHAGWQEQHTVAIKVTE